MPILFTKAYQANGKTFATLKEAQCAELEQLFTMDAEVPWTPFEIANAIAEASERIIDILTTTESSRPMARKANGGSKKRKPKTEPAPAAEPAPASEPTPAPQ